jgi:membrane-associated phospholipid phosphatase
VRAVVLVACLALVAPAVADDSTLSRAAHAVSGELRQYGRDLKDEVLAPTTWNRDQWAWAGLGFATIGALMHYDQRIEAEIQGHRNASTDSFARAVTPFGGGRAEQLAVAMIVIGAATHHDDVRDTGRDAFEAELIAGGLITPMLKRGFGRGRPNQDENRPNDFDPLTSQESFPSGHATNAFALASVVAAHSNGWLIPTLAYSLAGAVAASRLNDNVHWASDVVAGALIGASTGRFIAHRHRNANRRAVLTLVPLIGPRRAGLSLRVASW